MHVKGRLVLRNLEIGIEIEIFLFAPERLGAVDQLVVLPVDRAGVVVEQCLVAIGAQMAPELEVGVALHRLTDLVPVLGRAAVLFLEGWQYPRVIYVAPARRHVAAEVAIEVHHEVAAGVFVVIGGDPHAVGAEPAEGGDGVVLHIAVRYRKTKVAFLAVHRVPPLGPAGPFRRERGS